MKRSKFIIAMLFVYIIAAFAWWTYAHYINTEEIYKIKTSQTELLCFKATYDFESAKNDDFFNDTTQALNYFKNNYPDLELIFMDPIAPLDNFMIRPSLNTYNNLKSAYNRKIRMYIAEGVVMMFLLFIGIIIVYQSFRKTFTLKRQQSNFLLSITHELKTPLASIKLYIETLQKRKLNQEQTQTILVNTLADANRLQNLTENLLLSAQIENKKYTLNFENINLSNLVQNTVNKYIEPRNLHNNIQIKVEPNIQAIVDKNAFEMLLYNLLNNAIKYADSKPEIVVELKQNNNQIIFEIADNGPGILNNEKKEIFNIFYRIGDENTRKTKGTGLGLYIVSNIIKLHKGSIEVLDNKPKGTIFKIILSTNAT